MDQDDPEKRIADLERRLAQPRTSGDPGADPGPRGGSITPEQVRAVAFSKPPIGKRGYNEDEVDAFLDLLEATLRNPTGGGLTAEDVRTVAFAKPAIGKRGYNEDEVDAFLDLVEEQMNSPQDASTPPPQAGFRPPPNDRSPKDHARPRSWVRRIFGT